MTLEPGALAPDSASKGSVLGWGTGDEGPDPRGYKRGKASRLLPRLWLPLGLRLTHTYTAASDQSPPRDVFASSPKQTGVSTQLRETLGGLGPESRASFKVLVIDQRPGRPHALRGRTEGRGASSPGAGAPWPSLGPLAGTHAAHALSPSPGETSVNEPRKPTRQSPNQQLPWLLGTRLSSLSLRCQTAGSCVY